MPSRNAIVFITSTSCELIARQTDAEQQQAESDAGVQTLDGVNLKSLANLPQMLSSWHRASANGLDEVAVVLMSDDEFPRWPGLDREAMATWTDRPVLVVRARPNLRAAWSAQACGALAESADGSTICSITMQDETTDVAVCRGGEVIDTASMSIGPQCMRFDSDLQITSISETGETFLDAVAKKIKAADLVEETMVDLISALIGEAIANLICRKKAPQVTQRLLVSDPLKHDYQIDRIMLSGTILEFARQPQADPRSFGHLGGYLAQNILASFTERQRTVHLIDALEMRETVAGSRSQMLSLVDMSAGKLAQIDYSLANAPVIAMPRSLPSDDHKRFLINRIEERIRRFHIEPGAPILVSLHLPAAEPGTENSCLEALALVETARAAIDATMFLKKPRDFAILMTVEDQSNAVGKAKALAAAVSHKNIKARIILVETPVRFLDGDYVSWDPTGTSDRDIRFPALIHRLLFQSPRHPNE